MRVLVNGATGKMGQEVCKAIGNSPSLTLVGGVNASGKTLAGVEIYTDLSEAIKSTNAELVVDFTTPSVVQDNMEICFVAKVPMVIGTTGISETDLANWQIKVEGTDWKAIIAPNFAIGALLLMKFSVEAINYFPNAEIIEYHHAQKLDAPSGTALRTQALITEGQKRQIPIHSVRLPGLVAHQEVIFGLPGQTLTIRHDSTNRESFMPGVLLAIEKIDQIQGVVLGLEHILFTDI